MGDSKLKMNDDKTELMAIGTRSKLTLPLCPSLVVIYHSLSLLGTLVFTDETLSMDVHIKYLCRTWFC